MGQYVIELGVDNPHEMHAVLDKAGKKVGERKVRPHGNDGKVLAHTTMDLYHEGTARDLYQNITHLIPQHTDEPITHVSCNDEGVARQLADELGCKVKPFDPDNFGKSALHEILAQRGIEVKVSK